MTRTKNSNNNRLRQFLPLSAAAMLLSLTPTAHSADIAVGQAYGGGTIAYVLQPGDAGYDSSAAKGVIVSSADLGSGPIVWTNYYLPNQPSWVGKVYPCLGATAIGLRQGDKNTATILASKQTGTFAAQVASQYSGGGFRDWVLPSKDDLDKIYSNQKLIGKFPKDWYWSSTEWPVERCPGIDNENLAYARNFSTGESTQDAMSGGGVRGYKGFGYNVRAVRYFSTPAYTIGGTLSGLPANTSITLQDNGADTLVLRSNSRYTFAASIPGGMSYRVSVQSAPAGYTCSVSNASGSANSNVSNVNVTCTRQYFSIGGSLSGLPTNTSVTLQDNGSDNLFLNANGPFTFRTSLASGQLYNASVLTSPAGYTCTASNNSGMANANVSSISVICSRSMYSIGGTLSGLPAGASILLRDNDGDNLTLRANGIFRFNLPVASGAGYNVTVQGAPQGYTCTASANSGIANGNISNVSIACERTPYRIGGTLRGLPENSSVTLQDNGADNLNLSSNGAFTFTGRLTAGQRYNVTVLSNPNNYSCKASNNVGIANADINSINIDCARIYTRLYSFPALTPSNSTGATPFGSLTQLSDKLYGTTAYGGANGKGTVFSLSTSTTPSLLMSFGGNTLSSAEPHGSLLALDNMLYGMTFSGGAYGRGSVFKMSTTGAPTLLHSFNPNLPTNQSQGLNPDGRLLLAQDGYLYGLTSGGGKYDKGALFKISTTGSYTTVYSFGTIPNDGATPLGSLIQGRDGTLYGLTSGGGSNNRGTVFSLTPTGGYAVLYSFGSQTNDGRSPRGSLLRGNDGYLYGITQTGGAHGRGTVFKLAPGSQPTTFYAFGSDPSDKGAGSLSTLIQGTDWNFYGLTNYTPSELGAGKGTIFKLSTQGAFTNLYTFGLTSNDGAKPFGDLLQASDGTLYGTTYEGGDNNTGTVFSYRLP